MWFSKFVALFRKIDRFGSPIEFNHKGDSHIKSVPGSLITLAVVAVFLWYLARLFRDLNDKSSPSVSSVKSLSSKNSSYDLGSFKMLPALLVANEKENSAIPNFMVNQFATIHLEVVSASIDYHSKTRKLHKKSYPMKPCYEISNKGFYQNHYKSEFDSNFTDTTLLCADILDGEELEIYGEAFDLSYQQIHIGIYPCSLKDKSKCKDENLLSHLSFGTIEYQKYIDFSDFEDPLKIQSVYREDIYYLPTVQTIVSQEFSKTIVQDIDNSVSRDVSKVRDFPSRSRTDVSVKNRQLQTYCSEEEVGNEEVCTPYIKIKYKFTSEVNTFTREYLDFFTVFSNFGGFKELVITFAVILLYVFNKVNFSFTIAMEVFNVAGPNVLMKSLFMQDPVFVISKKQRRGSHCINLDHRQHSHDPSSTLQSNKPHKKMPFKENLSQRLYFRKCMSYLIESTTDFASLIREINNWKILKEIVFSPYQLKLIPLVALEMEKRTREAESHKQSKDKNYDHMHQLLSVELESISYHEALENLYGLKHNEKTALQNKLLESSSKDSPHHSGEPQKDSSELISHLRNKIDDLLVENLPEGVLRWSLEEDHLAELKEEIQAGDNDLLKKEQLKPSIGPPLEHLGVKTRPSLAGPRVAPKLIKKYRGAK